MSFRTSADLYVERKEATLVKYLQGVNHIARTLIVMCEKVRRMFSVMSRKLFLENTQLLGECQKLSNAPRTRFKKNVSYLYTFNLRYALYRSLQLNRNKSVHKTRIKLRSAS